MTYLFAVDPSLRSPGIALFEDGELVAATRILKESRGNIGVRCSAMADHLLVWLDDQSWGIPFELAFEWPQIYRAVKSKGDPNDLIALAGIGMALAGKLQVAPTAYTPAEWAGQLPKWTKGAVDKSPRALRIRSRLSDDEAVHWRAQHDLIDAIGIGLHHLGRLKPRRVYPGAT